MKEQVASQERNQDSDLRNRVTRFLADRLRPTLCRLDVDESDGIVTLRGVVHSFHEKQLAISCCQRVAGVTRLVDHLQVKD